MLHSDTSAFERIKRVLRFLPISAALVATAAIPSVYKADADTSTMLVVDVPVAHTVVKNGDMLEIGGWTAGSRIDVYLDGPADVGIGIGSTFVGTYRPDVMMMTGSESLALSGFRMDWEPKDMDAGHHVLWVYSLVGETWVVETVPFMTGGLYMYPMERGNTKQDDKDMAD